MKDELKEEVRVVQDSMVEASKVHFVAAYCDDLRAVTRIVVEFHQLLQTKDLTGLEPDQLRYESDTVFSGVNSFALLSSAHRMMEAPRKSMIEWGRPLTLGALQEEFVYKYGEFSAEVDFEKRCRLLLDLFKLQIVFAGMSYE